MGLRGDAAIVGYAEWKSERHFTGTPQFSLEQWAALAALALADAGIDPREVDDDPSGYRRQSWRRRPGPHVRQVRRRRRPTHPHPDGAAPAPERPAEHHMRKLMRNRRDNRDTHRDCDGEQRMRAG